MKQISQYKIREILDLLIEFVYLVAIFIVPLYFSFLFPTYNIFEFSKFFIFKIAVWLLLLLTIIKISLSGEQFCFKDFFSNLKKYWLIPIIFILGLALSLVFSFNPIQSFFGSYDRQAGYLSYLFGFFWFGLIVFNIRTIDNRLFRKSQPDSLEKKIKRVLIAVSLSGLLVALYGVLQILGIDFLKWPEDPLLTHRTLSTFGQPNFLASWLLLVIPLSAYLFWESKKFLLKFFYFLIFVAQLVCLFFTSSRGGLIALGLTILLFIFYFIRFAKLKRIYKFLVSLGLVGFIIISLWVLNFLFPGRFNSLFDPQAGSFAARLNFYQAAADSIIKKPAFGYGLENSSEVFIKYYQPDWGVYGDVGATTDKAHNLILDIILAVGFFGFILFALLYYHFFRLAGENIKQKKMGALSLAFALGAAAYLFSLLFSFSIIAAEVYFWLWLALLTVINSGERAKPKSALMSVVKNNSQHFLIWLKRLLVIICCLGISSGLYYEFRLLAADYYFNQLYYILGAKQYFTVLTLADYIDQAKTNPVNQEYYSRFLGDKLSDFYPEIIELSSRRVVKEKLQELDRRLSPRGYENIYVKAKINSVLGNYDLAEKYFHLVTRQTPFWPKTYIELGRLFARFNRYPSALVNYRLALSTLPDINDSRLNSLHQGILNLYRKLIFRELGDIYFKLKNYPLAEENYQLAYRADLRDFTLLKKIADTYYLRGNLIKALEYNQRGALRNPSDYNWPLAISALYQESGDQENAQKYIDQAIKLAPTEKWLLKLKTKTTSN